MTATESPIMEKYIKVPTNENEKISETIEQPVTFGYGIRHVQMGITFICLTISFVARGHLGVTIVAMTSHQHARNYTENITNINGFDVGNVTAVNDPGINIEVNYTIGRTDRDIEWSIYKTYDWSKPIQETVLSSFFLGYCLMMFPIALVCQRWGGKVPLQISLLINGLVSLLTPWLILWGDWKALSACRVAQGLAQAGTFPGTQTLLAKWVPINERATLSSYVYTGTTIGNIIGFQMSGILADSSWGWPATYWAVGVLCLICFVFLTVLGASTPMVHKTISEAEKSFIMGQSDTSVVQKRRPVPWKAILTSRPVLASWATHVGAGVAYVFILTQVPSFMHYILGIDVKSSGILSSLPYFASFFAAMGCGWLSDYLTNKKILRVKTARRVFNSVSQVGAAVSLICVSFTTSITVAVICFAVTMSCYTGIHSGWMLNHIDLSPNYSGTLMAIGNVLTNTFVVIMPILVSNVVVDVRNPSQWRTMLCIVAGVAFLANIVFVIFLSVDVQPWDEGQTDEPAYLNLVTDLMHDVMTEKEPVEQASKVQHAEAEDLNEKSTKNNEKEELK